MSTSRTVLVTFFALAVLSILLAPSTALAQSKELALDSDVGLKLRNVTAEPVVYKGREAIKVTASFEPGQSRQLMTEGTLAIVEGVDFHNGVIEVDLAGAPLAEAVGGSRGFIGVIFRMSPENTRHERIYLRPTNGRAEDQERRNHSTQYVSFPDYGWRKLRTDAPGRYEAYVDLVPGEWTKVKIEVNDGSARLFVHGNEQPTLIVNDLKLGAESQGAVALWIHSTSEGYFSNLRITHWP